VLLFFPGHHHFSVHDLLDTLNTKTTSDMFVRNNKTGKLNTFFINAIDGYFIVCFKVFNATVNNISVISWRSVLLVEETGVPGENH